MWNCGWNGVGTAHGTGSDRDKHSKPRSVAPSERSRSVALGHNQSGILRQAFYT
jgi:hypothetical protein